MNNFFSLFSTLFAAIEGDIKVRDDIFSAATNGDPDAQIQAGLLVLKDSNRYDFGIACLLQGLETKEGVEIEFLVDGIKRFMETLIFHDLEKKVDILNELHSYIEEKDSVAVYLLASYYEDYCEEVHGQEFSAKLYEMCCTWGYVPAMYKMSVYYDAVRDDINMCFYWLFKAIENEKKNGERGWWIIKAIIAKMGIESFIGALQICAQDECIIAQFLLAQCYVNGDILRYSEEKTSYWLDRLSRHSNTAECIHREYLNMKAYLPFEISIIVAKR